MQDLRPFWESLDQSLITAGINTIGDEIANFDTEIATETAVEGEGRIWTRDTQIRLFTRYNITYEPLRHFYVGAGFRYASAPIMGKDDQTGELFMGEIDREVDLLFGWAKNIRNGWFRGSRMIVQLNVNNVLQQNDYFSIRREGDGQLFRAGVPNPRQFRLSWRLRY
jgi:hypothetical protein